MAQHPPRSAVGEPTSSPHYLRSLLREAQRRRIDTTAWFKGLGFDLEDLDDPGTMLSRADGITLLRRALAQIDEPELGLSLGMQARVTDFGGLALGLLASPTLDAALSLVTRYPRSSSHLLLVDQDRTSTRHALTAEPQPGEHDIGPFLVDKLFASHLQMRQQIVGAACTPLLVELVRDRPDDASAHERCFGCPVVFGSLRNRMVTDAAWLDSPLPLASEVALRQAIALLEREARQPEGRSALVSRIERAILQMLPAVASQAEVARALFLSERSLRRKLAAEGVSFRSLLDRCRQARATELMVNGKRSASEAAAATGFAALKNFQRAHRRWTAQPADLAGDDVTTESDRPHLGAPGG